ncbi:MAG: hypothetical protein ACLGHU_14125 [Alphaproteobacteria bacterium]
MTWQPLWTSPGGVRTFFKDNHDGTYTVMSEQDTDPILDQNKAMATHNDGWSESRDMRRAASIPMILVEKWKREQGVNVLRPEGEEFLKRVLNDADYQHLRTAPGRI